MLADVKITVGRNVDILYDNIDKRYRKKVSALLVLVSVTTDKWPSHLKGKRVMQTCNSPGNLNQVNPIVRVAHMYWNESELGNLFGNNIDG